jgi:dTDP-N-acetylfucosamine:lipid II N-acetylfucosaminyltransferase
MRVLHLLHDDKFTDYIIDIFEKCNQGQNVYLVGTYNNSSKFSKSEKQIFANYNSENYNDLLTRHYDLVIIHFLDANKAKALKKLSQETSVCWLMWGGDFYESGLCQNVTGLYQPETLRILKKNKSRAEGNLIKQIARKLKHVFVQKKIIPPNDVIGTLQDVIPRIDFIGTVIPEEFCLLQNLKGFRAEQVFFSYATIEHLLSQDLDLKISDNANSILIGNSNTATSNHLDVFKKIRDLHIFDKVIVPLSYGGDVIYRDQITSWGRQIFKNRFVPLETFITAQEYRNLLLQCSVAIFNHNRQQAVGNIILMVYLGARVFLSEESLVYSYLKQSGVKVFSFQKELNNKNLRPLDMREKVMNRERLLNIYGTKPVEKKVKDLLQTVGQNKRVEI